MTIKALIFDIGGVLFRFRENAAYQEWERKLGLKDNQLYDIVFNNPVSELAMIGHADVEDVWTEVAVKLSLDGETIEILKSAFYLGGYWDTELLGFIRSMRGRYKTGVISDAWLGTREAVSEWVNDEIFDVTVFSAEERIRKPHPDIYKRALSLLEVAPQEAVFVDDMPHNIEGARTLGIHAIHFDATFEIRDELARLLEI